MIDKNKDIRKLVSIKTVDGIEPIENADKIEVAVLGGWKSVIQKNTITVGEKVLYFEIDSFLPNTVKQFEFLTNKSSKKLISENGKEVEGHILKTVRLRGKISQGLILKLELFPELSPLLEDCDNPDKVVVDYFEQLGVFKYEKPIPVDGDLVGSYPDFTRKTDSQRVQNLSDKILEKLNDKATWFATEKADGQSTTFWKDEDGKIRVATRNYEVLMKPGSVYQNMISKYKLDEILQPGDIIKGELIGPGINGNNLKVGSRQLWFFDWESDRDFPEELKEFKVPTYDFPFPKTVFEALDQVNGLKSKINPEVETEGIVWWNKEGLEFEELDFRPNFKAINNNIL